MFSKERAWKFLDLSRWPQNLCTCHGGPNHSTGKENPYADAGDRSFTIGEETRGQLPQGRKYLGDRARKQGLFVIAIYSCIGLFLYIMVSLHEAIVKAEIKLPG